MTRSPNPCLGATLAVGSYPTEWYGLRQPFTPSNTQLIRYAQFFKHSCVLNYLNTPPSITFDDAALRTMRRRYPEDPLYQLIDEYREVERCLGTYVRGMAPEGDGRYREEFRHTPKTLRLAMKLLQLLPRSQDPVSVYSQVRGLVVASPGSLLMARDYSGIEAALLAYLANDAGMYRLAAKVQGMHDFVATHAIGQPADLSWSDADVQGYFATFKKENRTWTVGAQTAAYGQIRQGCKRAGFLSFYGGTAARMQQVEPGLFPDRKTAQWYQDLIFGTFPSIKRWQWQTCEEAEKLGYVTAPSGFRLWYPDGVFEYTYQNRKWEKKFGAVAKECLAAKPQHMGMWCSAKALARAIADPVLAPGLRLSIHDEILGEWDQTQQEDVDGRLKAAMEIEMSEMPLPASWGMGAYVVVQTEAKSGQRWADMK